MRYVQPPTYIEIIGENYPHLNVSSVGDGNEYELLACEESLPSKSELDLAIVEKTKERMWKLIQVERDRRRSAGVKIGNYWFHSDDTSRIQQLGLLLFGTNMPPNLMWKTLSGEFILMSPALAQQIFTGIAVADQKNFGVAEQHKAQMMNNPNPETYDFLSNAPTWPKIYGE